MKLFAHVLPFGVALGLLSNAATEALAVTNLAVNPGFEDANGDTVVGDGWSSFGAAGFHAFFGANGHASLFADNAVNVGGVYQGGIAAIAGQQYQFDLLDTRIERNWDALLRYGLEFYAADDATSLGDFTVVANTAARLALAPSGELNGAVFSTRAVAPVGTAFVRPIVKFDNVNENYDPIFNPVMQTNGFVFDAFLSATPAPGGNLLKNSTFEVDVNDDGSISDVWRTFGNAGVNAFFGPNAHGSLFANSAGNSGGIFQQSILADPGSTYQFTLPDVRIESAFDANLRYGIEFYADNDVVKVGEVVQTVPAGTTGDGLSFTVTATAPAGAVYARPIVLFDNVNPAYAGQPQANAFVFDTSLVEVVGVPGDYNQDGAVNAADYTVWRDGLGGAGPLPNEGASPGAIDNADYTFWASRYGATSTAATAIPEPASVLLVGAAALVRHRRRRSA
ncbi:MAG: hypothetical protein ACRCT8_17900 [Lacipirellulaceae bacterium]